MNHHRSSERGGRHVPIPLVVVACAAVLSFPAALAIAHQARTLGGLLVHHHTENYLTCNAIDGNNELKWRADDARKDWQNLTMLRLEWTNDCDPADSKIKLMDGYYGDTGWRASSIDNDNSNHNAGHHPTIQTRLKFNLSKIANWNGFKKRTLACREFGMIIGVQRLSSSQVAGHGGSPPNDCMSFRPSESQTSGVDYANVPKAHSTDLVDQIYTDHRPQIELLPGAFKDAIDSGLSLTDTSYEIAVEASDGPYAAPDAGVESVEVEIDGEQVVQRTEPCLTPGQCALTLEEPLEAANLSDGQHTVSVKATDELGLEGEEVFPVTVDAAPPPMNITIRWIDPATGQVFDDPNIDTLYDPFGPPPEPEPTDPPPVYTLEEEPELEDPYTDEWVDPDDQEPPVTFDEVTPPIAAPDLDALVRVVATSDPGASLQTVKLKVDEQLHSTVTSSCENLGDCEWVLPRDDVIAGKHELELIGTDLLGNQHSRQVLLLDSDVVFSDVSEIENGYESATSGAAVRLADQYTDGVTMSGLGMEAALTPVGEAVTSTGNLDLARQAVLYEDSGPDTDRTIEPTTSGVEERSELDSATAPEILSWDFALAGETSELQALPGGAVVLTRDQPDVDPSLVDPGPEEPDNYFDVGVELSATLAAEIDDGESESEAWSAGNSVGPVEQEIQHAAELVEASDELLPDAEVVAAVEIAQAVDADGESVAAVLSTNGSTVEATVDHQGEAVAYPVEVELRATFLAPYRLDSQCRYAFSDDPEGYAANCVTASGTGAQLALSLGNSKERIWCVFNVSYCEQVNRAKRKAEDFSDKVWSWGGNADDVRPNAFKHMFWVMDMVNRRPDSRSKVKGVYRRHEWSDSYDEYLYKMATFGDRIRKRKKFESQMDMLNNRLAWGFTTTHKAKQRRMVFFCEAARRRARDAKYLGLWASPYAWANQHESQKWERAVFRRVRIKGSNIKPTLLGRYACGDA